MRLVQFSAVTLDRRFTESENVTGKVGQMRLIITVLHITCILTETAGDWMGVLKRSSDFCKKISSV